MTSNCDNYNDIFIIRLAFVVACMSILYTKLDLYNKKTINFSYYLKIKEKNTDGPQDRLYFYRILATALQLSVIRKEILKGNCINVVFKFILHLHDVDLRGYAWYIFFLFLLKQNVFINFTIQPTILHNLTLILLYLQTYIKALQRAAFSVPPFVPSISTVDNNTHSNNSSFSLVTTTHYAITVVLLNMFYPPF